MIRLYLVPWYSTRFPSGTGRAWGSGARTNWKSAPTSNGRSNIPVHVHARINLPRTKFNCPGSKCFYVRPILTQMDLQAVEKILFSTFAWALAPKMLELCLPRLRMSRSFLQDLSGAASRFSRGPVGSKLIWTKLRLILRREDQLPTFSGKISCERTKRYFFNGPQTEMHKNWPKQPLIWT